MLTHSLSLALSPAFPRSLLSGDTSAERERSVAVSETSARTVETAAFPAITIGYELDGSPNGVPVLLLHGFPDTTTTWDRVVELLPTDELWMIRPHIRGHGSTRVSPGFPVSAETSALATDVTMLADHLGVASFHVVGSDWGSRAAYALAGLSPQRVRSMVTLGTGYNEATPIGDLSLDQLSSFWYQWLFQTEHSPTLLRDRRVDFCRHLWRSWSPGWDFAETEFADVAAAVQNDQFPDTVLHYYRYRWGAAEVTEKYMDSQRIVESMPDITVPTTHIQGLEDHCTRPETARRWEDRVTAPYRRVDLAGVGHFPQREAADRVADEILTTIRSADR
jgi:pimeloyl-ACP methyl ester carboxylesterase